MSRHQIMCIRKRARYNPTERITHIGGLDAGSRRRVLTQEEAIAGIESGRWTFFVRAGGREACVIVRVSRYGNKYLTTEADDEQPDNLLSLPECP